MTSYVNSPSSTYDLSAVLWNRRTSFHPTIDIIESDPRLMWYSDGYTEWPVEPFDLDLNSREVGRISVPALGEVPRIVRLFLIR